MTKFERADSHAAESWPKLPSRLEYRPSMSLVHYPLKNSNEKTARSALTARTRHCPQLPPARRPHCLLPRAPYVSEVIPTGAIFPPSFHCLLPSMSFSSSFSNLSNG
jgi:hypothetical protein